MSAARDPQWRAASSATRISCGSAGPALGAIVTMWRGSPSAGTGHVFFYLGENDHGVLALGGNQSDRVCRQYEPRDRIVGYWWPKSVALPMTGKIVVKHSSELLAGGSEL